MDTGQRPTRIFGISWFYFFLLLGWTSCSELKFRFSSIDRNQFQRLDILNSRFRFASFPDSSTFTMRTSVLFLAVAALVVAQEEVVVTEAPPSTITAFPSIPLPSLNVTLPVGNRTRTRKHPKRPHKEPTPTFKLDCECPTPIIPINQLTPAEICEFEFGHRMGCYFRSNGGCALPTLACGGSK